jgi:hypothetical protein
MAPLSDNAHVRARAASQSELTGMLAQEYKKIDASIPVFFLKNTYFSYCRVGAPHPLIK